MTRINLVDPTELMDQHLVAEYREIFMVGSSLQRSLRSPNWRDSKIPPTFRLNTGHVSFFYDKGEYLHKRYHSLVNEMKNRGMNPDPKRIFKREQWPNRYYKDWVPTESDKNIVRKRIQEKIQMKPHWYRKTTY